MKLLTYTQPLTHTLTSLSLFCSSCVVSVHIMCFIPCFSHSIVLSFSVKSASVLIHKSDWLDVSFHMNEQRNPGIAESVDHHLHVAAYSDGTC